MTPSASLKSRVRRLEQAAEAQPNDRAEVMRLARGRRLAMTPSERAEHEAQRLARCIAALSEPDLTGDAGRAQRMRRSLARRHLAGAAA